MRSKNTNSTQKPIKKPEELYPADVSAGSSAGFLADSLAGSSKAKNSLDTRATKNEKTAKDKKRKAGENSPNEKSGLDAKMGGKSGIRHIAFIMDGNGRWAKQRLLPRAAGHREGLKTIEIILDAAKEHGINCVSFFAFSTENWSRPKPEVDALMDLLRSKLPIMAERAKKEGFRLVFSGDTSAFSSELKEVMLWSRMQTAEGGNGIINICLNYGGRQEIVAAANRAIACGQPVTMDEFSRLLYTSELPDPDFLIRTGGEWRVSNFMLFQLAYTELYFCDKLWPDFDKEDFAKAIEDFCRRNRRFGRV